MSFGELDHYISTRAKTSDGGNLSVPLPPEDVQEAKAPWPHADQSPLRPDLGAIQGLLNLLPNGPEDGGLVVMNNSANKFGQLWKAQEKDKVSLRAR